MVSARFVVSALLGRRLPRGTKRTILVFKFDAPALLKPGSRKPWCARAHLPGSIFCPCPGETRVVKEWPTARESGEAFFEFPGSLPPGQGKTWDPGHGLGPGHTRVFASGGPIFAFPSSPPFEVRWPPHRGPAAPLCRQKQRDIFCKQHVSTQTQVAFKTWSRSRGSVSSTPGWLYTISGCISTS